MAWPSPSRFGPWGYIPVVLAAESGFTVQDSYEHQVVDANQQVLNAEVRRYKAAFAKELSKLPALLRTASATPDLPHGPGHPGGTGHAGPAGSPSGPSGRPSAGHS